MNASWKLAAATALIAVAGCNGERGGQEPSGPLQIDNVAAPAGKSWDQMVTQTAEGGYLMGNPDAKVKLVEFGSMTCPHCAEFDENVGELADKYVKTGQVSFEFRNYVRDGLDMAMSLTARCGGPERFFPLTDALFKSQEQLFSKVQSASPAQQQQVQTPQDFAQLAGLQQWAAQRGLPSARINACLGNDEEISKLVQMQTDASTQYQVPGTPSFLINGKLVEDASNWERLEPKLRQALGG